jgi:hypothetical protein
VCACGTRKRQKLAGHKVRGAQRAQVVATAMVMAQVLAVARLRKPSMLPNAQN